MNASPVFDDTTKLQIEEFEAQIDRVHLNLDLLRYPKNLAFWALVGTGLERLYRPDNPQVPDRDRTLQSALSRSFGVFLRKVSDYPFKGHVAIKNLRLSADVREAAIQANNYARFWFAATGYFPEWHQGEVDGTMVNRSSLRFSLMATKRQRELSAYQKSFRAASMRIPSKSVYAPIPPWIEAEYSRALRRGTTGDRRLLYDIPQGVYEYYRDWYTGKMQAAVEHPTETDLGAYDIGDAIRFWSSLAAFSSVHDFLCYVSGVRTRLPLSSILPVRKRREWAEMLARLSGLTAIKCDAVLDNIICRPRSVVDLHMTPFLALDDKAVWLALAVPLAISGRFDQNLLRICSADDPVRFNRITPKKERRLRDELRVETAPLDIRCLGPFSLPAPLPDVDVVLEDIQDDTLVISELKWIRQPIGWKSRLRANQELGHGLEQLRQVRDFLGSNPNYLVKRPGGTSKPISQYHNVYYSIFIRGHLIHVEPKDNESMIPLDALKQALKAEGRLGAAMVWLLSDAWLPCEDVDFRVLNSRFSHQGFTIEAPIWSPVDILRSS
jgi:hypothetical protein